MSFLMMIIYGPIDRKSSDQLFNEFEKNQAEYAKSFSVESSLDKDELVCKQEEKNPAPRPSTLPLSTINEDIESDTRKDNIPEDTTTHTKVQRCISTCVSMYLG